MSRSVPGPAGAARLWRLRVLARRLVWRLRDLLGDRPGRAPPVAPPGSVPRVLFVVCEPAKWSMGPLFDLLAADPGVEAGFCLTLSDVDLRLSPAGRRAAWARNRAFFAALGPVACELYDPGTDRVWPARRIAADLVFIQQPWGMQDLPRRLAGRVRCAYAHYGLAVIRNDAMQFGLPDFHPWLWCHVVPTALHRDAIAAAPGPKPPRVLVAGYPKLDVYHRPPPACDAVAAWPRAREPGRRRVIFAPHHALAPGTLALGTFDWSGPVLLELARACPEVDFLIRPHPNMALGLARAGVMDAAGWRAHLDLWRAGPNTGVFEEGGYFDVFRSSDAMITDSGAFLAEYLPTGRPLIRLERDGAAGLNDFGQLLRPAFYIARDARELRALFEQVVLRGEDPLAAIRAEKAALVLGPPSAPALAAQLREALSGRAR